MALEFYKPIQVEVDTLVQRGILLAEALNTMLAWTREKPGSALTSNSSSGSPDSKASVHVSNWSGFLFICTSARC